MFSFLKFKNQIRWYVLKINKPLHRSLFFAPRTLLFFVTIFTIIFICYYPHENESYFRFPSNETQIFIIDKLLRASAVFIGIIISLVILSFQIFNKRFGRYAFVGFFKNKYLKTLFTLYILNILLSIYSLSYLKEVGNSDSYSNALFVFCLLLAFVLILSLFPLSIEMIYKSQSRFNINKIINLITKEWIYEYDDTESHSIHNLDVIDRELINQEPRYEYNENERQGIGKIERIEKNPIAMLKEIGANALVQKDNVTIELILNQLFLHLKKIVFDGEKDSVLDSSVINRYMYNSIRELVEFHLPIALNNDNNRIVRKLTYCRNALELFVIKNRLPLSNWSSKWEYRGWDICFDYEKFFNKAILLDNRELAEIIMDAYHEYCEYIVRHYLPNTFREYKNYYTLSDEADLCSYLLNSQIRMFVERAILYKRLDTFKKIFNLFSLEITVLKSGNTVSVKRYLLHLLNNSKEHTFKKYLNHIVDDIDTYHFPYGMVLQSEIKTTDTAIIFSSLLESTKLSLSKNKLNNMMINRLKTEGMGFINDWKSSNKNVYQKVEKQNPNHFLMLLMPIFPWLLSNSYTDSQKEEQKPQISTNDIYKKLFIELIKHFEGLKDSIPKKNCTDYQKEIYIHLHRYMGYIKSYYINEFIDDTESLELMNKVLNDFDKVDIYRKQLQESGYLINENLF